MFLILIAVVLFAALSYAFTHSSQSGNTDVSDEKADLMASDILQYSADLENALLRLKLTNRCEENEMELAEDTSNARADHSCDLFHPDGGNVVLKILPPDYLISSTEAATQLYAGNSYGSPVFPDDVCIDYVGTGTCTNQPEEKEFIVGYWYLKESVCRAINRRLGINDKTFVGSPAGDTVQFPSTLASPFFAGQYKYSSLAGIKAACILNTTRGGNTFYSVIYPR